MTKSCSLKTQEKSFLLNQGQASACCKSYPVKFDKNLKHILELWDKESQELDQGIEIPACNHCWADEKQGRPSRRQTLNADTQKIDIYISNLCNHMCSYCSPKFSSVWEESIKEHGAFINISKTAKLNLESITPSSIIDDNFAEVVEYINSCPDDSIVLSLLGGEPLMQHHSLDRILNVNQTKIRQLVINTNLNPPSNKFLVRLIEKFNQQNKLLLHVSLDSTPGFNHLPRAGFDVATFESNLLLLKENNVNFDFMSVVSALSVFDLHNFLPWVKEYKVHHELNALSNPRALHVRYLPYNIRQEIKLLNKDSGLPGHLIWDLDADDPPKPLQFEQYNYVAQYFDRTKIDPARIGNSIFTKWWTELNHAFK